MLSQCNEQDVVNDWRNDNPDEAKHPLVFDELLLIFNSCYPQQFLMRNQITKLYNRVLMYFLHNDNVLSLYEFIHMCQAYLHQFA